jgi:hypothetical protein
MRENGKDQFEMAMESKNGLMEQFMKVNGGIIELMEKVVLNM